MASRRIRPSGKVFRDPVHQLIRIDRDDEFLLDLIDTPEFQRLRRIRQLGVSSLTYPGAEHSRFQHSLGVYWFAQRILDVLTRRYRGHEVEAYLKENGRSVKAAALLHDIGHGPFSHVAERAFGRKWRHEKQTTDLILYPDGRIHQVLTRHGLSPEFIAGLIQKSVAHPLLIDIVSSELDADRMDYLLRDSHFTGVQYGVYDAEWLLNAMCVGRMPMAQSSAESRRQWRLALDRRRGRQSAEQLILARTHMTEQVYFHRVTRGFEVLLLRIFTLATQIARDNGLPQSTPEVVGQFFANENVPPGKDWLQFDEAAMYCALHAWANEPRLAGTPLAESALAFLTRERPCVSVAIGRLGQVKLLELGARMASAKLHQGVDWHIDTAEFAVYKGLHYSEGKADAEGQEDIATSILLSSGHPDDTAQRIEISSDLMRDLDGRMQSMNRVYIDRKKMNDARTILKYFNLDLESEGGAE